MLLGQCRRDPDERCAGDRMSPGGLRSGALLGRVRLSKPHGDLPPPADSRTLLWFDPGGIDLLNNGPGRVKGALFVRLASAFGLAMLTSTLVVPAAQADVSADLTVLVNGPATASVESSFAYSVVVTNTGPDAADGATLTAIPPGASTHLAASCTVSSGGATCPSSIAVSPGGISTAVPSLPTGGSITLTITGTFANALAVSVTATVSPPSGVADPRPDSNRSVTNTTLAPKPAEVRVSTSVDVESAAFGQEVTYTTAITNRGLDDLSGLGLGDYFQSVGEVGAQYGLDVAGRLSCDASPSDAAPCPRRLASPEPFTATLNGSGLPVTWPVVDVPAGKTIYLKVTVGFATSHCGPYETRQVRRTVELIAPRGVPITGPTRAESPALTLGPCTGLAVEVTISNPSPPPGQAVTTTVTVYNSAAGPSTSIPLVIHLPDSVGLSVGARNSGLTCSVGAGAVACPTDLAYDPVKRTISGTVAELPAGERFSLILGATAGVVPGDHYATTAAIQLDGRAATSTSTVTYKIVNSEARVSASVTLQGGVSPRDLTFTGSVRCAQQGTFPFSLTIPAGATTLTRAIGSSIWLHDACTVAVTGAPQAPDGYVWASRGSSQADIRSLGPIPTAALTFALRPTGTTAAKASPPSRDVSTGTTARSVPPTAPSTAASDGPAPPKAPNDVVSVLTGAADSSANRGLAAAGVLVLLVGLGVSFGRP